jgi:hypothetical protein
MKRDLMRACFLVILGSEVSGTKSDIVMLVPGTSHHKPLKRI